jgi:SAM-dependent methyltransferase
MTDLASPGANDAMFDYWNNRNGEVWVRFQAQLDRQLEPLGAAAVAALAPSAGEAILDVGCGCGDTTVRLGAAVGPSGRVVGADISHPILEVARRRPRSSPGLPVEFHALDAQTADLGEAAFDAVFSRFGVMFFSDPVAAFVNLRRALKPAGRLAFVCWRPLAENPWMGAPMAAAAHLLPPQPASDPLEPGPFAFADAERVRGILTTAGFAEVRISPFDTRVGRAGLEDTVSLNLNIGPLARALRESPDAREAVTEAVRSAMAAHVTSEGVLMPAAVWIVTAKAS